MWIRTDFKTIQNLDGKSYWQTKIFDYYDCVVRKNDFDNIIHYNKQGNNADSYEGYVSIYPSIPYRAGESRLDYVCSQAGQ